MGEKTSGRFDGSEPSYKLHVVFILKDAQGGSQGAFLSITQCSVIHTFIGQVDVIFMFRFKQIKECKTIKKKHNPKSISFTIYNRENTSLQFVDDY